MPAWYANHTVEGNPALNKRKPRQIAGVVLKEKRINQKLLWSKMPPGFSHIQTTQR